MLRLPEIYTYSVSLFMFKYSDQMMPTSLDNLFKKNKEIHSYNTRGANKLRNPKIRTKLAENFITNMGVKVWNSISEIIDPFQKIGTFKKSLIIHLIRNYE